MYISLIPRVVQIFSSISEAASFAVDEIHRDGIKKNEENLFRDARE